MRESLPARLFHGFRARPENWLVVVLLAVCIGLSIASPAFLTVSNLIDLVESYSVRAILAMGLFVVLIAGGIDISFAAVASVAQYVAAALAAKLGLAPIVVLPAGLAVGVLLGCLNATLIHYARVTSIIITIATMNTYFAFLMFFTGGHSIYDLPDWWSNRIVLFQTEAPNGDLIRITLPILVMVLAIALTWFLLNRTRAGRQLYAMGGNIESARRIGISIAKMHYLAYGFLGFMAALAGLLQAHRVGESVPNALYGSELDVLSAAVLGGASLAGGVGTVGGVVLGILLLAVIQNGLNLLGISPYCFSIITGAVIVISTSVTVMSARGRRRSRVIGLEVPQHG
ncbi:ABC transporter permease [Lichenicola cladoniae]|uniref:ABC transporter permease n=1 Tax=Lichenicola cladoniae TaxID=1484109 RepID=A0A6M8HLD1_9PROT|nr:ABC transporter permease [Lichenicola cladoniae]NPD68905.1 ABC transporter permease [Acetobacteraceae bacterium]QKE89147.1 ABC transporter permease [Lichenicola cladoniae]